MHCRCLSLIHIDCESCIFDRNNICDIYNTLENVISIALHHIPLTLFVKAIMLCTFFSCSVQVPFFYDSNIALHCVVTLPLFLTSIMKCNIYIVLNSTSGFVTGDKRIMLGWHCNMALWCNNEMQHHILPEILYS